MIAFPRLGSAGRLGNQLFQIAGTIGIARSLGEKYSFPEWDYQPYFSLPATIFTGAEGRDAGEIPLYLPAENRRFLQDISLWIDYEDEIRKLFMPSVQAEEYLWDMFPEALGWIDQGAIAVHVRRGDNVQRPNPTLYYAAISLEYYRRALALLPELPLFVVTDDVEWCETVFQDAFPSRKMMIGGGATRPETVPGEQNPLPPLDWTDMFLMARCQHHVISNSTYSWWGAWLAGNESPIYPSGWYGTERTHLRSDLIIPNDWIKVYSV